MTMDHNCMGYTGPGSGMTFNGEMLTTFLDPDVIRTLQVSENSVDLLVSRPVSFDDTQIQSSPDGNSPEDPKFVEGALLKYINRILMEEDVEDKACSMFQESAALQAAEKSFYEAIGEQYPTPPDHPNLPNLDQSFIIPDHQSAVELNRVVQVQAAKGYLQNNHSLIGDVNSWAKVDVKNDNVDLVDTSRGKKNPRPGLQEERSNKQSAVFSGSDAIGEMFDTVLLNSQRKNDDTLRKALNEVVRSSTIQVNQTKGGKSFGKKEGSKRGVVDLISLLTLCAQAVAVNDHRTANEFLRQIRQHSTPTGDGMQRLAYYFADGLEARMAGSGTQVPTSPIKMPSSAADMLKAYHIYITTCPFRKVSHCFASRTIMQVAEKATRLHIIDFGIRYGFQWPAFIQRLASRPGGPPKLRVTGVDFPFPGFRPLAMIEETGRRLASYAETFRVPFEFNAIVQKWETIRVADFKLEEGEVLAVNSIYRMRHLLDETVMVNSPKNFVLNLIRMMNPAVFVMGVVNAALDAPFFNTRFRAALFHYSSFFDMFDANIPRDIHDRMLLERGLIGMEAMNVIACEGAERIERPETYKQWHVRNLRAGFEQLPLDKDAMRRVRHRVESHYHKDFVIDEDGDWLLQGWKGRIIYACSSWRPAR